MTDFAKSAADKSTANSDTGLARVERIVAVIPARMASTRLPGKVLLPIAGVPMVGWVYRAALACPQLDQVLIATDSQEVAAYAYSQGWPSIMTSSELASGTDRVHAVAAMVDADIYVNIQGDEPMIRREHIDALLRPFALPGVEVTTLSTACTPEEMDDPNAVKVVTAKDGRALYFSRHHSLQPGCGRGSAQAPGPLRLSQGRPVAVRLARSERARIGGEAGATAHAGERHGGLC